MFYETAHTIGPGWHKSFKPSHYDDMTWSPSSKHFRSPGSSPQNYRRIIHSDDPDRSNEDDKTFGGRSSPSFPRKIFRDVWDESPTSNHRFGDRPRLFKRGVFKPNRWEDDEDDFERTRNSVRQMARDFTPDFDSHKLERDFDSDFHHRDRNFKADIEEEFEKAAGRVHHIPIMVERRLDEMRSKFGRNSPPPERPDYQEESDEWQGPQVQRLKKNFERDEFSPVHCRQRVPRADLNKPRAFTSPIPSRWDPESAHTLPIRRSKNSRLFDEPSSSAPKSVFRSYSETHEDIPKHHHPQHAAAFRSHSDGHCPKTTYVTKISVNLPSNNENSHKMTNGGDIREEPSNNAPSEPDVDDWDSHQSNQRTSSKSNEQPQMHPHTAGRSTVENMQQNNTPEFNPESQTKNDEEKVLQDRASMQQISAVLQNVDDLIVHVEAYNGTGRDKQFRFLDEMLTRCMLRLDDVDTEGRDDIRTARKAAVMQVQLCIEKLESKANECEQRKRHESHEVLDASVEETETQENEQNGKTDGKENPERASSPIDDNERMRDTSKPEDDEQTRL